MLSRPEFACAVALLAFAAAGGAWAQAAGSALPDAPAPAQSAAPGAVPPAAVPLAAPAGKPVPADANPFPGEDPGAAPARAAGEANPLPEQPSGPQGAQPDSAGSATGSAGVKDSSGATAKNPFPEGEESSAPLAPGSREDPGGTRPVPNAVPAPAPQPGYSSSNDSKLKLEDEGSSGAMVASSGTTAKDLAHDKQVAELYYGQGNWEGAYLRYRDAVRVAPKDADAVFGLAECERRLGRNVTARQHYSTYLALDPDGRKARAARKYVAELPAHDTGAAAATFAPGPKLP